MKISIKLIALTIYFIPILSYSQNLSLVDLEKICSKKNWESVNEYLNKRGWEYYESKKGETYEYDVIVWSHNRSRYNDEAEAWFNLFTYQNKPSKLNYYFFNKPSYNQIQKSIKYNNYSLIDSEIRDNEIISKYSNSNYILTITTEKTKSDYEASITTYYIKLIEKSSVYDPSNGIKVEEGEDETKIEYTLKNGILSGPYTIYYKNGNIKLSGYFINNKKNGDFTKYDEYGNKTFEYSMVNDSITGILKTFKRNMLATKTSMINNMKSGKHYEYAYNDENEKLIEVNGFYNNDVKEGCWSTYLIRDGKKELFTYFNYSNDKLHGAFQEYINDSLVIGSYDNGKLNGLYRIYFNNLDFLTGNKTKPDTSIMTLIVDGHMNNGKKTNEWKFFYLTGTLNSNGFYKSGEKSGEWKYYLPTLYKGDEKEEYSGKLYTKKNYKNGKLNGKSVTYSSLIFKDIPCDSSEVEIKKECQKAIYEEYNEIKYYVNDKLNGSYKHIDSIGNIIFGYFKNDKRDGTWYEINKYNDTLVTANFFNGQLHGDVIVRPNIKYKYKYNQIIEKTVYALGKPYRKYEIYNNRNTLKETKYSEVGNSSQEYWIEKKLNTEEFNDFIKQLTTQLQFELELNPIFIFRKGKFIQYDKQNKIIAEGNYSKNDSIDIWKFNFRDQNLIYYFDFDKVNAPKEYYTSENNVPFSGTFIYKSKNGITEERKIKNGYRNGKTTYLNDNNEILKKEKYKNGVIK